MNESPEEGEAGREAADSEHEEAHGRLAEAVAARRQKLERLRARGVEPFALRYDVPAQIARVREDEDFRDLPPGSSTDRRVGVAGRIALLRRHGRLTFVTIRDSTGELQLLCSEEVMGAESYTLVDDLDLGDIVGAQGEVVTTRRGELSIRVETLTLLTKALRPLPEKWHGIRDPEVRLRQRYLEFVSDPASRRIVHARARTLSSLRATLQERGFLEVETPVLQVTHGGALAQPFVTHHNALDVDLYLRIAPELYLKRLLVAGFERVFEIGRNFRNEGIDWEHNPEFTMLEAYQAYATYEDMMELDEALAKAAAMAVRGALTFDYRGRTLDLSSPWRKATLLELASKAVGDQITLDRPDLAAVADKAGVRVDPAWGPGKIALEVYEKLVEPDIWEPTIVKDFPREVSPLARPHRSDPGLTEHFDLVICAMEIGPAYSELTDPDEQRARFASQQVLRRRGDHEAHPLDEDFLRALEHGMPPAGGLGFGVDRMTMILADVASIRDVIAFPHLRPEAGR